MTAAETAGYMTRMSLEERLLLEELYQYCLMADRGKVFLGWSEESMKTLIAHRLSKGRVVEHRNKGGELDGLGMWMRVEKDWNPEKLLEWPDDDEDGKEIFIGAIMADSPFVRRSLILRFLAKEPDALHLPLTALRQRGSSAYPVKVPIPQKELATLLKR